MTNSSYVFYGNSGAHDDPGNVSPYPVGAVISSPEPNNRFVGGDNTADLSDITLTTTPKLLARLEVTADTGLPPDPGDTFTISVNESGTSFQHGDPFNPTMVPIAAHGSGTITVVPEPSTWVSLGTGLAVTLGYSIVRLRRRRRALPSA